MNWLKQTAVKLIQSPHLEREISRKQEFSQTDVCRCGWN